MKRDVLGIDVGKHDLHCSLLSEDRKPASRSFPNSEIGLKQLQAWLSNRCVTRVHICLEATGGFSEEIAILLHEHGHIVSIVNPSVIRAFGEVELSRTKTDKADAGLIARYCATMSPEPWVPPSASQRRLQRLARRRVALVEMRAQEQNRLQAPGVGDIRDSIEASIAFFDQEIRAIEQAISDEIKHDPDLRERCKLLESIPGLGKTSATTLMAELGDLTQFASAKALTAFVGLCPRHRQSGTSIGSAWLSKFQTRDYNPDYRSS